MKIIILNYEIGAVEVVTIPVNKQEELVDNTEACERYIDELGFHLSSIEWMLVADHYGIPVYYNNNDEPAYML